MTEQKQNEKLAKWLSERTGKSYEYEPAIPCIYWHPEGIMSRQLRVFDKSLDSMALIQDAMNDDETKAFIAAPWRPLSGKYASNPMVHVKELFKTTAAQRAEAACRALGIWEDER